MHGPETGIIPLRRRDRLHLDANVGDSTTGSIFQHFSIANPANTSLTKANQTWVHMAGSVSEHATSPTVCNTGPRSDSYAVLPVPRVMGFCPLSPSPPSLSCLTLETMACSLTSRDHCWPLPLRFHDLSHVEGSRLPLLLRLGPV